MDAVFGVQRVCSATVACGAKVSVAQGSVVDYSGSAIVNAANEGCVSGGGVDGAVNARGGQALLDARRNLPVIDGSSIRCRTGDSKITTAGALECQWVIHAVGPNYHMMEEQEGDRLLYSAYRSAMVEARRNRLPDVAFSLLSAGIFRADKPLRDVLAIAALAVSACAYEGLEEVFLVGFTRAEVDTLTSVVEDLLCGTAESTAAATEAWLERLSPTVRQMHRDTVAGVTEELPAGWSIAWQAVSAVTEGMVDMAAGVGTETDTPMADMS